MAVAVQPSKYLSNPRGLVGAAKNASPLHPQPAAALAFRTPLQPSKYLSNPPPSPPARKVTVGQME